MSFIPLTQRPMSLKNTNIEWIGEIPSHWDIVGFTRYIDTIIDYRGKTPEKVSEGTFLLTAKNIKSGRIDYDASQEYVKSEDYAEIMRRGYPHIGDVIFTTEAPLGEVAQIDREDVAIAQRVVKFSGMQGKIDNKYLKYSILSSYFQHQLFLQATGSTALGIKAARFPKLVLVLPPYNEQENIINFLDRETVKIDALIADKQRMIELLQERRQALITEAVTKGLDRNAPMKDSGVEWIGEIPEGWSISRLGYETWVRARLGWKGLKADEYVSEGYIFLATPNIKARNIDFSNVNYIDKVRYDESPEIKLKVGDILLAKDGSTLGTVNVVRELPSPATVNSSIAVITPNEKIHSIYLYYLFQSQYIKNVVQSTKDGMGVPHLFQEDINKFYIILPTMTEQEAISRYLDNALVEIEVVIKSVDATISALQQYRQSIITEAVTGRICVTGRLPHEQRQRESL